MVYRLKLYILISTAY